MATVNISSMSQLSDASSAMAENFVLYYVLCATPPGTGSLHHGYTSGTIQLLQHSLCHPNYEAST